MKDNLHLYERYFNTSCETRWATNEEIQKDGTYINLHSESYPTAGLPLLSDGKTAYVDGKDTHTIIFGATGSKKTRLFCMPMINMFAKAGESFVATDPKGELYEKTAGLMKANGYDIVALNFRDIGKGAAWNPLALPYELYHSGKQEEAIALLNDFVASISAPQRENTKDIFWPEMASSFALACLLLLMECAPKEKANIESLAIMCSDPENKELKHLAGSMDRNSLCAINFNGVFTAAPTTLQSILVTLFGMIRIFNTQKSLTAMLSNNSVDLRMLGNRKTALYIIVPDEKSTFHFLVTLFIKQAYEILINEAQKHEGKKLPVRVNFVLDEFCNIPKVPDMPSMISASRSRNMRYFLIAQSLHQLRGKYGEDADTIKGNCDNWVFLTSRELDLLDEISRLCGETTLADGRVRRLISPSELQRLSKEKGEALILHARQYPIITQIADIDMYEDFKGFSAPELKPYSNEDIPVFYVHELYKDVVLGKKPVPFKKGSRTVSSENQPIG